MWKDEKAETLNEAIQVLSDLIIDLPTSVLPCILAIRLNNIDAEVKRLIVPIISEAYKTPEFLLDMAPAQDKEILVKHIKHTIERIDNFIQLQQHPDNLPEILYGQREFGCVYLPTELLKRLYMIGESILDSRANKIKLEEDFVMNSAKVMLLAADWVEYSKRKWGIMDKSEMTVVSPLSKEEAKNAVTDIETTPPF